MAALAGDNHSIILDMALGSQLSLDLGDDIQMTFPEINETVPLRVIGFFRRSVPYTRPSGGELQASWSFVSLALLNELNSSLSTQNQIVAKMQDPNAGMLLEEQIAGSSPDVLRVVSVASYVTTILGNRLLRAPMDTMLMISLLGAGVMVIGVVSISSLAVEERAHDLQILSMRGFSSASLLTSVSIEYISLLLMALPVLFFVGIGWGVGSINALNNPYLLAKAQQATSFRFILTGGHLAWIGGLVLSGSLALFVPAIFAVVRANRNVEELGERGWH
ncbi:MAG: hypothetical protein Q6361_03425 [Candidatus Hermodarchaeota archaeon]|nr:hypothetical protein [Candidatus Hermodarchaeota archaeon]